MIRSRLAGAVLAVAMVLAVAEMASADPLVYVSVLGRVQGAGTDYENSVAVHAGDTLEYQLWVKMAALGATNTAGTIGVPGGGVTSTTTALVPGMDGVNLMQFNVGESASQPIQIDFSSPVTLAESWMGDHVHNLGWSPGTVTARSDSAHDIMNIRPMQAPGIFVGVLATDTPAAVLVASGTALVTAMGSGGASTVYASDRLPTAISNFYSSLISINNEGLAIIGSRTDTDPVMGFQNLTLTPEPATLSLLLVGGAAALARRWRRRAECPVGLSATHTPARIGPPCICGGPTAR
jgi:hypothetical protein